MLQGQIGSCTGQDAFPTRMMPGLHDVSTADPHVRDPVGAPIEDRRFERGYAFRRRPTQIDRREIRDRAPDEALSRSSQRCAAFLTRRAQETLREPMPVSGG